MTCEVCRRLGHAKWHEHCRCEINPIALIEFVESHRKTSPVLVDVIVGYVAAVTGMDMPKMRAAVAELMKEYADD